MSTDWMVRMFDGLDKALCLWAAMLLSMGMFMGFLTGLGIWGFTIWWMHG